MKSSLTLKVIGGLLGLVLTELIVRIFLPHALSPIEYRATQLEYVPAVFARHVFPEKKQECINVGSGTRSVVNRLGYRGADFEIEKHQGSTRVVVFGGSFAFDIYNQDGDTWPEKLKQKLKLRFGDRIQVINAGIPGHSASDAVGRLYTEVFVLKPDIVILPVGWNDIKDLAEAKPLIRTRTVYSPAGDPYRFYQNGADRILGSISQAYLQLRTAYYNIKLSPGAEGRQRMTTGVNTVSSPALEQFGVVVRAFAELSKTIGAKPILVIEPTLVNAQNTQSERERIVYGFTPFSHGGLVKAYASLAELLRKVGRESSTPVVDLNSLMNGRPEFFYDHVHMTAQGSAAAGAALVEVTAGLINPAAALTEERGLQLKRANS